MNAALSTILDSPTVERVATGFGFTEGPLWHPDGVLYFVDLRRSQLLRWQSGKGVEVVRENTGEGNGLTFDRQGRLIMCEGGNRRVSQTAADGTVPSPACHPPKRAYRTA
jgi:sugar lactone lactonase YvrE